MEIVPHSPRSIGAGDELVESDFRPSEARRRHHKLRLVLAERKLIELISFCRP
jgi:hypothetical protein